MSRLRSLPILAVVALGAGCGDASLGPQPPLPVTAQVSLAPGAYALLTGTAVSGAVEFPAAGAAAEYLVVGQLATATAIAPSQFTLGGQASVAGFRLTQLAARPDLAQQFHMMLRRREAEMARAAALAGSLLRVPPARTPPPTVGSQRTFKVCATTDCTTTRNVRATAQFVGVHAAIFLDDSVPPNGLTPSDIAEVGNQFDTVLYPIDTDRFGTESDVDGNGVVIVLLTKQINALIVKPACNNGFITGYFFSGDLDPRFASQYNNGEVFYGMVPDPLGSVSCAYSTAFVKRVIPVTFIHEFQHMISFNQHVLLRGGQDEVLWLNEAMSHAAEELGGLHYDSLGVDSTASRFLVGNLYNASLYLLDPASVTVVNTAGNGSLAERGAGWLLVRYLLDRFGPATSRTLEQTNLTGDANIQAASGLPFETVLGRWMLALYVSDLPGFTAPSDLTFDHWHFRTTFASLHQQDPQDFPAAFPLQPDSGDGAAAVVSGTVSAGSGAYLRALQPAGAPSFALSFRGPDGKAMPASRIPQLAVVRVH